MNLSCRYWQFYDWTNEIIIGWLKTDSASINGSFSGPGGQQYNAWIPFLTDCLKLSTLGMLFISALPYQSGSDHISCMHMITTTQGRAPSRTLCEGAVLSPRHTQTLLSELPPSHSVITVIKENGMTRPPPTLSCGFPHFPYHMAVYFRSSFP